MVIGSGQAGLADTDLERAGRFGDTGGVHQINGGSDFGLTSDIMPSGPV